MEIWQLKLSLKTTSITDIFIITKIPRPFNYDFRDILIFINWKSTLCYRRLFWSKNNPPALSKNRNIRSPKAVLLKYLGKTSASSESLTAPQIEETVPPTACLDGKFIANITIPHKKLTFEIYLKKYLLFYSWQITEKYIALNALILFLTHIIH